MFLPVPATTRQFRIAFLPEAEGGLDITLAHKMANWLSSQKVFAEALKAENFSSSIFLQPADGFNDLKTNLDSRQYDAAFCPAAVYATLKPGYTVILQEKRVGDVWDTRAGGEILRQGVVFMNARAASVIGDHPSSPTLQRILLENDLAVPSAFDAAGYQYPLLSLVNNADISPAALRLRFCGSSEEVIKQVVSGMSSIGACDKAVLENWLPNALPEELRANPPAPPYNNVIRILPLAISPVPTDPVIIRQELRPSNSAVGRLLKELLPRFFRQQGDQPFALEGRAKDEFYQRLWSDLNYLDALMRRDVEVRS